MLPSGSLKVAIQPPQDSCSGGRVKETPRAARAFAVAWMSLTARLTIRRSGSSAVSGGTGSVAIAMTDGAAEDFDEINVTVVKIELLSDSGRVTIYEGDKTFNLLDLADKAELFAIRDGVPAGRYSKIRLTLTKIELVKKDADGNVIDTAYPKLPGNGKLDLNPRGDFTVYSGETLVVQIDMDANKSIHIVGTGSGKYQFRPVVFVDVISEAPFGKLVRLHGVIDDINRDDREFKLCETDVPVRLRDDEEDYQTRGCIQVDVVRAASIFDADGQPARFRDLVEGEEATVYGRFRREDDSYDREEADDTVIDLASPDDGPTSSDSDGDREAARRHHEMDDLELVAEIIELGVEGTFQQLDGVAESLVDADDRFTMSIDPGQGFVAGSEVAVQLQQGTKIIFVTHDIGQARRLGDDVVFLHRGRVAEHSPAKTFFDQPLSQAAADYLAGRLVLHR